MLRAIVQLLKILTIGVTALLVATGGARVFDLAIERATPEDVGEPVEIAIAADDDADDVAERLADAGLIRSKLLFSGQMRVSGGTIEEGTYTLRKGMTVPQIVDTVSGVPPDEPQSEDAAEAAAADVGAGETVQVTIPEGHRIGQIAEAAEDAGIKGGYDAFTKAVEEVDRTQYDFLADLPEDATLEGFLFPDTYDFIKDDPEYNVRLMLDNFGAKVTPVMRDRARQMGIDLRTVLNFAALVEREAKLPAERPIIADVYIDRYANEMNLEADPTVQYVIGKPGSAETWWPQPTDEDLFVDSPYNTYQNTGLPPGPICNPGIGAIQAVLEPAETDYIFFVATGDEQGSHAFAATKEGHDANVAAYRDAVQGQ